MSGRSTASSRSGRSSAAVALLLGLSSLTTAAATTHGAEEPRSFAIVDLSPEPVAEVVRGRVEQRMARTGLHAIKDLAVRRALAASESPYGSVARIVAEADTRRRSGDCAGALERAHQAEEQALATLPIDDERGVLKVAYAVMLICEDQRGGVQAARDAAMRLRGLVATAPAAVSNELWARYVPQGPDGGAADAAPSVELRIDTDPPNGRLAVNFRGSGTTPRTVRVPRGVAYVEVQKNGYKKTFRRVTVGDRPIRLELPLVERKQDRTAEIEATVAKLRGADPHDVREALARVAELARVDVLVAIFARDERLTIWSFDADRGDFAGPPAQAKLPLD